MTTQTHLPNDVAGPNSTVPGLEPLLSIDALAEYVGVPVVTIYRWRTEGKGPCALRIGRHLKFPLSSVQSWLDSVREASPGTYRAGR